MPIPTPSRSVRGLAAGAALVSCSLASAGSLDPLSFSILESAAGFANLGSTTGSFSFAGPGTYMNVPLAIGGGSGFGSARAYHAPGAFPGYDTDLFLTFLATTSIYTSGISNVSFTVTIDDPAVFGDAGLVGVYTAAWTLNGTSLVDGDVIAAGTHTFVGSFSYSGVGITSYAYGFFLAQASVSPVPLPGAAGLAALGLAGLSRRRR